MEKLKILYLINSSEEGGAEIHLLELAKGMKSKGYDVFIFSPRGPINKRYKKNNLKQKNLFPEKDFDLKYIFQVKQFLEKEKIDILHTHLLKTTVNGLIAGCLAKTELKVAHIHGTLFDWEVSSIKRRVNVFVNALVSNQCADKVIALTKVIKKDLIVHDKIKENKIVVIPNGLNSNSLISIEDKDFLFRKYGWDKKEMEIVGIVGRLTRERGHEVFIKAAEEIINEKKEKNIRFVIVGDGKLKSALEDRVSKKRLDNYIKFTGFLNEKDKNKALSNFSIFVSSAVREGFGLSVLQAMFAKIPLVVSNLEVYNEVCPNGKASLFAKKNEKDFADKIMMLISDKKLRIKLTNNAFKRAKEKFSLETFLNNYDNFYKFSLKNKDGKY